MLGRLTDWGVLAGGIAIIVSAVFVTVDVFLRKFLGISVAGADEFSTYAFAAASAWSFSQVLLDRANVRVDILLQTLPKSATIFLDIIALLGLAAFSGFLMERAGHVVLETYASGSRSNTPLQTPLIVPQVVWLTGIVFLNVNIVRLSIVVVAKARKRDWDGIVSSIGTPSVESLIEEHKASTSEARGSANGASGR